ncbi:MAG: alpha/beta hydrolase [Gammaproteobacteria bacterium]
MSTVRCTLVLLTASLAGLSGCSSYIAHQIVEAPNRLQTPVEKQMRVATFLETLDLQDFSRTARVPVGPPPAMLSIAVLPPGNAGLEYTTQVTKHHASFNFHMDALQAYAAKPKGTIVLLPAFQNGKYMMLPWAFVLAKQGYQCVLVDLRGEGLSTGDWVTWGNVESRDVEQLIQWLDARNIVAGPLVLMGVSYGASMALRSAALDAQVRAVVAIEPFVNAVDVIKRGGRLMFPTLSHFVSDAQLNRAIEQADKLAATRLENASTLPAARRLTIPVLYVHADEDRFIPEKEFQQLVAATNDAQLIRIADANHITLPIEMQRYQQAVLNWLAVKLNTESAPRRK